MGIALKQNIKNKFGQYFTPKVVADFMIEMADISQNSKILEPSCGEGIFLERLLQKGFKNLTAYEIDKELAKEFHFVKYESFVSAKLNEKFDLIIGPPPYIRWKIQFHVCNLDQNFKGTIEEWAKLYLKHFVEKVYERSEYMINIYAKRFEKYIQ